MSKTQTLQLFFFCLFPEYQICRTSGDVERRGEEKLTQSNSQVIYIIQSKEGSYTLSRIN